MPLPNCRASGTRQTRFTDCGTVVEPLRGDRDILGRFGKAHCQITGQLLRPQHLFLTKFLRARRFNEKRSPAQTNSLDRVAQR